MSKRIFELEEEIQIGPDTGNMGSPDIRNVDDYIRFHNFLKQERKDAEFERTDKQVSNLFMYSILGFLLIGFVATSVRGCVYGFDSIQAPSQINSGR